MTKFGLNGMTKALARELDAPSDGDTAVYDETALMLVCLLGRAPAPDEDEADGEEPGEAVEPRPARKPDYISA